MKYYYLKVLFLLLLFVLSNTTRAEILISDNFADGDMDGWQVVDEGTNSTPSNWAVINGEVKQSSDINGPNRKGTFAFYDDPNAIYWSNYQADITIRSGDNDGIGLMFYYQDADNYYKVDIDKQRNFSKLVKRVNGVETTLKDVPEIYLVGADMLLHVMINNNQISVELDGVDLFGPINDSSLSSGTIALYCWANNRCFFDDVYVADDPLVADAGNDQNLKDVDANGEELVSLDGSASFDSDGIITNYEWRENDELIANGSNPEVYLSIGTHRLELTVTDDEGNTASDTVSIYVESPSLFRVVVLPDTQRYSRSHPQIYEAQTDWIAQNHLNLNIKFVIHEGDIVNNNSVGQWSIANSAMSKLDNVVPYSLLPGNHDLGTNGSADKRDSTLYNDTFPVTRYSGTATFGGVYTAEPDRYDNNYHTFHAGGTDWLVLSLEFGPRDPVLDWANQIVAFHPFHRVIVVTHTYMFYDDTRHGPYGSPPNEPWNPHIYGLASGPGGVNDGEEMWDKFIKKHSNISFVLSGHVLGDGLGQLVSHGNFATPVYQFLTNYQMRGNGGNGFLRLLEIDTTNNMFSARAYSPYTKKYKTDPQNEFTFRQVYLSRPLVPSAPATK